MAAREDHKLKGLMAEWVDVPLYGFFDETKRFPSEIYSQSNLEHKHYDTLSTAAISGLFILFGYPYIANPQPQFLKLAGFVFSAISIIIILLIYNRMAWNARIARRVMHHIEAQFGEGFSLAYPRQDRTSRPTWAQRLILRGSSITFTVQVIAASMVIVQLTVFFVLALFTFGKTGS